MKILYKGQVVSCEITEISRLSLGYKAFSAYCKTDIGDMWVHSYTEDMNNVFSAEVCDKKDSLSEASNYSYIGDNSYGFWGGRPVIKYNWQKSPVRERY